MKIAFNPSTVAALTTPPNNKDITFDLRGHSIFARGVEFKGTDTNTWRDIKINNVSIGSHTLDLRNGSNTTLTNTNGVVTINSTWRPVVDNLTSDSTTSSLSAKQGKVLKALIDGKSNSDHNHDGKYLKLTGGTMLGALNFANNTWNLVGDDSYIGDCNISGHFGIKAANTTYPGITFFNNASTFLGNLTAYSGNIKYGAYSLQFLDNGNTSVSASTWTNPFSNYNSNAVADGQAICVWGQSSYLSNLSTDTGDMSLWLKRINANVATLNMVLDGEYYANGNQRLAHVSEIPNKDSWNYDDRYLRLTGGWMSGDINFGGDNKIYWGRNTDSASISFKNDGDGDANSYMSFVTSDNGNEYFRWSHSSGSTNTEWMALRSDGLRVRGTKVSLEGHSHNDLYYTKAESNAKYITDIATSVNKLTFTRNGSNIARNITVNVVYSQGNLTDISNKDNTTKASSGLYIYNSYNQVIGTNSYSSVLSINTGGTIQIAGNWGDDQTRNLYWRSQSDRAVSSYPWKSWRTILDSENYSSTLDSRYYTESEVNSLLDAKLNRQNLSYGNWNPRGYHLAADYHYNGGDLSISENNGKMYISVDGCFWQNEGQYRVLDTSDIGDIRDSVTLHQYLSATDAAWYPLVWGGNAHKNTSDSTGVVYKSYDKLSWQTSSQTLYATNIQTNNIKGLSIGGGIYWNPNVESASDGSDDQALSLVYTSYDSVRSPAGIKLTGSQGNEWFEAPRIIKTGSSDSYVLLGGGGHKAISDFAISTHTHGLLHSDLTVTLANTTTDSGWSMINSSYNGFLLKSIRTKGSAPNWIENDYAAGICFGGADTKGVVSVAYSRPYIKFAGGNGSKPVWWIRLSGISGATYNLANFNADTLDGYHENSFLRYRETTYTDQEATLWSQIGIKQYNNALPDNLTGVYNYGSVISLPGFNSRFEIYASHQSSNGNGLYYRSGWDNDKKAWLKFIDSSNIGSQSVNYANSAGHANSAGNADTLGGIPRNYGQAPFGTIPSIGNDGGMEIGRYIDFHSDNSGSYDYSTRIYTTGNYKNAVNLPLASGTLALTSDILNYYWANVKISTSSSTTTSPTVSNLTATSSIRMSNISLEHTDEINNITNGDIHLNYRNSGNVSLCYGGGTVGIGTTTPSYKLHVNGQIMASGFHHASHNDDSYVLLAGGGTSHIKHGSTYQSTAIQFGNYVWLMLQIGEASNGISVVPTNISNPTKDIYVMNAQLGKYSNSRHGRYRVAPNGVLYYVDGVAGMQIYTTICYVVNS